MKNKEISFESNNKISAFNKVNVYSIGKVKILHNLFYLHINNEFKQALNKLSSFSHILVFIKGQSPFNVQLSYRVAKVIGLDEKKGVIQVDNIEAENNTIIYDIKPYFPCEDRIEICNIPNNDANNSCWRKEFFFNNVLLDVNMDTGKNNELKQYNLDIVGQYKCILGEEVVVLPKVDDDYFDKIEGYSHARVLWWFDRFDKNTYRKTLSCKPPYENAPKTGVFATRSPVRPNLIASTVVKIAEIDKKNKCIVIQGFDGLEKSPILGIVPYIPSIERVKEFFIPNWLSHWPEWKSFNEKVTINDQIKLVEPDIERINRLISSQYNNEVESKINSTNYNDFDNTSIKKLNDTNIQNEITIYNARQNNLKNINVSIPKNKITVITGVSGSGKSSLAFDTIYAESQSQFIDLMSSTGSIVGNSMEKPNVEKITGLQPAIAIEQKSLGNNPRSTVGTSTGVGSYLKLLFATIGTRYCPECHKVVQSMKKEETLKILLRIKRYKTMTISPYKKGEKTKTFDVKQISEYKNYKAKLIKYLDEALHLGNGAISVIIDNHEPFFFQTTQMCYNCNRILFDITPSYFSFNNPEYMCPVCKGLGVELKFDESLIVNNPDISLLDGASKWWGNLRKFMKNMNANWMKGEVIALANEMKVDLELPYKDLPELYKKQIMYGSKGRKVKLIYENKNGRKGEIERPVEGAYNIITRLFRENNGDTATKLATEFMSKTTCSRCNGEKLDDEGRLVSIEGLRYPKAIEMTLIQLKQWLHELPMSLPNEKLELAKTIIYELNNQIDKLIYVGLSYLTLDRSIPTLSGGEAQRLRIATQFNTNLTNILYVMDEPSMGLHPRDYKFLIRTIKELKEAGNTIIMVEHEEDIILEADKIIDIGPLAGKYGGSIVAEGTVEEIIKNKDSITGKYLRSNKNINNNLIERGKILKGVAGEEANNYIKIFRARLNNLKNINVSFPVGVFTCVTGVSGSGKSSLISKTLYPALEKSTNNSKDSSSSFDKIEGAEKIKKVINVSQHPIGKTPRSNPATYTGVFDLIRELYSKKLEAKEKGFKKEHFSFNSKKGQCEVCNGNGRICTPMHFMPDIWVKCTHCNGKRYKSEVLDIKHNNKSIADVLDMDVEEALDFFKDEKKIHNIIKMISDVGLGYIKLGQSALTLSGGEAQRIKLAKELSKATSDNVVYILDEPTTGLHFEDIHRLLDIIYKLTSRGNTVIAIEHNIDFIMGADYIIDMGPEGGVNGGYIIATGTPNEIIESEQSITGKFIKSKLI